MNSLKSLKNDNNGNLLLIGTPEIKIPEKMFFMAKNGQVREAPTTTKTGALSMRGGIRSISLIPEDNKVDVVKLGETLEEFRKRQSEKEVKDLLNDIVNTKISNKVEMPEMPEMPKEKKKNKEIKKVDEDKQKYEEDIKEIKSELNHKEDRAKRDYKVNWRTMQYYIKIKDIDSFLNDKNIPNFDKSHFLSNRFEIKDEKLKEELVTEMYKRMYNPEEKKNETIKPIVQNSSKLKINKVNWYGEK